MSDSSTIKLIPTASHRNKSFPLFVFRAAALQKTTISQVMPSLCKPKISGGGPQRMQKST